MKGAKKIFTLVFFSIVVAFTTGCDTPIGSLLADSNNGPAVDYIKAIPRQHIHASPWLFKPADEMEVIGVFGGVKSPIDINQVGIKIIEQQGFLSENIIYFSNSQEINDLYEGYKLVVISYRGMEDSYTIEVGTPGIIGEPGWGPKGTPIEIDWPIDQ